MKERFGRYKSRIDDFLINILDGQEKELSRINFWGSDLINRIKEFVVTGKSLRGSLVLASYEMFSGRVDDSAIQTAAAIELLHSALLIHDDILDKDDLRRGKKTIHAQYREVGEEGSFADSKHFGYGMGICAGDICISMVFDLLGTLEVDDKIKTEIISLFSQGVNEVGLAEMDDFYMGFTEKDINQERILQMYKGKTARYTFSVPLMAGAILSGKTEEVTDVLNELSNRIGIIFQIKDDELGIFGTEDEIGKPVGSDLSEDKKTLFRQALFERASEEESVKLKEIFGRDNLSVEQVDYVKSLIENHGIRKEISELIDRLDNEAREIVKSLEIKEEDKKFLNDFMDYNLSRTR